MKITKSIFNRISRPVCRGVFDDDNTVPPVITGETQEDGTAWLQEDGTQVNQEG